MSKQQTTQQDGALVVHEAPGPKFLKAERVQEELTAKVEGCRVLLAVFAKGRSGGRSGLTAKQLDFAAALG